MSLWSRALTVCSSTLGNSASSTTLILLKLRDMKLAAAASLALCHASGAAPDADPNQVNQVTVGATNLFVCTDKIIRVTHTPDASSTAYADRVSLIAKTDWAPVKFTKAESADAVTVTTAALKAVVTKATGAVSFFELDGTTPVLAELATSFTKTADMGRDTYVVEQQWSASPGEALYGGGEFQNGLVNYKHAPVQLVQFNTEAIVPYFVSSDGYGILWDNYAWSYLNPADPASALTFEPVDTDAGTLNDGAAIGLGA
jgi:alpha-glucosidase (family GH31 glycosyl hydrolase)